MSIRLKLTITFLAVALIPLLLVGAVTFNHYRDSLEATRTLQVQDLADFKLEQIERYFNGLKADIDIAQDYYNVRKNLPILTQFAHDTSNPEFVNAKKTLDEQLQPMQSVLNLSDVMLVNPEGKVVYSSNSVHDAKDFLNFLPDPHQKAFEEGKSKIYFSDVYSDKRENNKFRMLVTAPVFDFNNMFVGVVAFEVDMSPLYDLIQEVAGLGTTGEILVGKKIGNEVVYLNPLRFDPGAALKRRIALGGKVGVPIQQAVEGKKGTSLSIDYRGKQVIAAWRYIPFLDWGMVAKIDSDEAFADVNNLRSFLMIIVGIISVLSGITAFSIAQSISKPIKKLSKAAELIGRGHLDHRVEIALNDEIGQLSKTLNKMTNDLKMITASRDELDREIAERKKAEGALKKAHDELEIRVQERTADLRKTMEALGMERKRFNEVLNMLPAYVILLSPDYRVPFANRFFEERFGKSEGRRCYEYLFNRTDPCDNCETYKVLKTNAPHHWEWTGPDKRNYDIYDFPFTDADGSPLIMEVGLDITEQKRAEESLRVASQYARNLIETSLDPLVTISSDGKITDVNEATIKATGVAKEQLIGTDFSNYFTEPKKAREGYQQVFAKGFVTDYPLTVRHKDGKLIDVLYNASVYKDSHGNVLGVFAAARDVTVQKKAEEELKRHRDHLEVLVKERTNDLEDTNKELARSNENLEQFAYVASHDLQEPLRMMASYSELLERRYKSKLDSDADEFINYIVDGAKRMQKLIHDLLSYSRVGRGDKPAGEFDCNSVLGNVIITMRPMIEESKAVITNDKLPVLMGIESNFTQLFQNLIGNAIKFHGPEPPHIHIGAAKQNDEWIFSVKDNGIGIELQYRERIFLIFQRLHSRDRYPGTGIGLSICKKIVETQGGRIWVQSDQGKGSTFYFTYRQTPA